MILLMLIGGSPCSTAGGMKTTTLAVLIANATATFRQRDSAQFFGRRDAGKMQEENQENCKFEICILQKARVLTDKFALK